MTVASFLVLRARTPKKRTHTQSVTSSPTSVPAVYDRRKIPALTPPLSPKSPTVTDRRYRAGFSLPEVIVALGLVMATALPTIGVLALGLGDARVAATQHSVEALRGTVRACLQDPAWPVASTEKNWSHSCYFDSKGAETRHRHQADTSVEARMTAAPGLGFDSPGLETVKVEFLAVTSGEILGTCLVQRARPDLLAANLLP